MSAQAIHNSLTKIRKWLIWRRLLGLVLIVVGLILISSFVKPYIYLATAKTPDEIAYPLGREYIVRTVNGKMIKSQGKIFIPTIKMVENLLEGVDRTNLDYGISHYSASPWPGMKGNIVLTGHNFFGQSPLFSLINRVKPNDKVIIHYKGKRYVYKITFMKIIDSNNLSRYESSKTNQLTLITCYPPGYTLKRLIIIANQETGKL